MHLKDGPVFAQSSRCAFSASIFVSFNSSIFSIERIRRSLSCIPSVIFSFHFLKKFNREEDDVSIGEACKKSTDEFVDLLYESVRHGLESDAFTSSQ